MQVSNSIIKNGKRHYQCMCVSCGQDRGFQLKKHISRECHPCSAKTRKVNNLKRYFKEVDGKTQVYCTKCNKWQENSKILWIKDPRRSTYDAYSCRACVRVKNKINRLKRASSSCKECSAAIGNDTKHNMCRSCYMSKQGSYRKKRRPRNEVYSERYRDDALYKLDKCIRALVYRSLRGKKLNKTEQYLGCSIEELKKYLESKWQLGMSWENYGRHGWHIDHIVPSSSASSVEELVKLQNYCNLQPLWAKDNLRKGARLSREGGTIVLYHPHLEIDICRLEQHILGP